MISPTFGEPITILGEATLAYNPTDEWIFPSIVSTEPFGDEALGKWYMYYSPHDAPGGLCLAYADELTGSWREYDANPLIGHVWANHYAVSHVASPHAMWMPEKQQLYLWFHGENDTTRYATSTDGIHFEYGHVVLEPTPDSSLRERSYARVFPNPDRHSDHRYVMLYMGRLGDTRSIYVARSIDGRTWQADESPLVVPPLPIGENTSGPWLIERDGRVYVLSHIDKLQEGATTFDLRGDFYMTPVSRDLRSAEPPVMFYKSGEGYPDFGRVADAHPVFDGQDWYMFYIGGLRLKGRIYARKMTW